MDDSSIKLFHLVGIMLLFLGLGGMVFSSQAGSDSSKKEVRHKAALFLLPGIGLLFILVSGIGMMHSLGLLHGDPPGWVKAKFLIFLLFGGSIAFADRFNRSIGILILAWILLGAAAAYLGLHKPF